MPDRVQAESAALGVLRPVDEGPPFEVTLPGRAVRTLTDGVGREERVLVADVRQDRDEHRGDRQGSGSAKGLERHEESVAERVLDQKFGGGFTAP